MTSKYISDYVANPTVPTGRMRTILQRGSCKHGHLITGPSDCSIRQGKRGWKIECKFCKNYRDRESAKRRFSKARTAAGIENPEFFIPKVPRHQRRRVLYRCQHDFVFPPPCPEPGDMVYCTRCNASTQVVGWGPVQSRAESFH